jgi:predicted transposase YdaD
MGNLDLPRAQAYDETIKNLQLKDSRALASLVIPQILEAEELELQPQEWPMAYLGRPDYVAKVRLHGKRFLLHLEFETDYRDDREMQRRMLRYYTLLCWHEDLPIIQAVVILKKPRSRRIAQGMTSVVLGQAVLRYRYRVVHLYAMDKYEVLSKEIAALCPLRVFMHHAPETDSEHLEECLAVAEATNDADYYFLTVECGHKLFGAEVLKKIVKEAVYMASELYQHPYERGRSEGKLEGKIEGKSELVLKQLAKKFGCLSPEVRQKLAEAKPHQLDLIAEGIFDFRDLDDVLRYIAPPGDGARALPADSRAG